MRKGRLVFWFISLVICVFIILIQKEEEKKIPYEEKKEMKVYCLEEFQDDVKNIIENSSIGDEHKVVFTDSKADAEFILTDTITAADSAYKKLGWTPLVVAFDDTSEEKVKAYEEAEYLEKRESDSTYIIDFQKIIDDTLQGRFEDKIYCPKSDTVEGKLFFDFLLANINDGKYPKNESEMEECLQIANKFLSSDMVFEVNTTEMLKKTMSISNEIYIIFEKDIYDMPGTEYDIEISYPENTVVYEYYYYIQGINELSLKDVINVEKMLEYGNRLENLMYVNDVRYIGHTDAYRIDYYAESDGFSYVEIPLKEE